MQIVFKISLILRYILQPLVCRNHFPKRDIKDFTMGVRNLEENSRGRVHHSFSLGEHMVMGWSSGESEECSLLLEG